MGKRWWVRAWPGPGDPRAGDQVAVPRLGGSILWDYRAGQEGQGGWGRGGATPGGKEWFLLNGGWEGSWSKSESESQEGSGGLRHLSPL